MHPINPFFLFVLKLALDTSLNGSECQGMFVAFTKEVDKCSPKLAGYYEQKKKFPSAKLALCSPSGQQLGKFEMKEVGIMKRGKRGQGEAMTLNFEKVEFKSSPKN